MRSYQVVSESGDYGAPLWAVHADGRKERLFELAPGIHSGFRSAGIPFGGTESEIAPFRGRPVSNTQDMDSATFVSPAEYVPATYKFPRNSGWRDTVGEWAPVVWTAFFGGMLASGASAGAVAGEPAAGEIVAMESGAIPVGTEVIIPGAAPVTPDFWQFPSLPSLPNILALPGAAKASETIVEKAQDFLGNLFSPDVPQSVSAAPRANAPAFVAPAVTEARQDWTVAIVAAIGVIVLILFLKGR